MDKNEDTGRDEEDEEEDDVRMSLQGAPSTIHHPLSATLYPLPFIRYPVPCTL
jgi:hypothetical protein